MITLELARVAVRDLQRAAEAERLNTVRRPRSRRPHRARTPYSMIMKLFANVR
jgi:hypothetical protein